MKEFNGYQNPFSASIESDFKELATKAFPDEARAFVVNGELVPTDINAIVPENTSAILTSCPKGQSIVSNKCKGETINRDVVGGFLPMVGKEAQKIVWWGDQLPIPPYEGRAYIWNVMQCYDLVRHWWMKERGHTPPNVVFTKELMKDIKYNVARLASASPVREVVPKTQIGDLIEGDIVHGNLMTSQGKPLYHCGIYLGDGYFLHHPPEQRSLIEPMENFWMSVNLILRPNMDKIHHWSKYQPLG